MNRVESKNSHSGKQCSICGKWNPLSEFTYGNRANRSYCRRCDKEEKAAYARGGVDAARAYRELKRVEWKHDRTKDGAGTTRSKDNH
jgi:hypothetical protein